MWGDMITWGDFFYIDTIKNYWRKTNEKIQNRKHRGYNCRT